MRSGCRRVGLGSAAVGAVRALAGGARGRLHLPLVERLRVVVPAEAKHRLQVPVQREAASQPRVATRWKRGGQASQCTRAERDGVHGSGTVGHTCRARSWRAAADLPWRAADLPRQACCCSSSAGASRVATIAICTSGGRQRSRGSAAAAGDSDRTHDPRRARPSVRRPRPLPFPHARGRAAAAARTGRAVGRGGCPRQHLLSQGPGGRSSAEAEGSPRHSGREGSIGPGPSRGTGQRGEASGDAGRPSRRARRRSTPQPGATTTSSTSTARRGRAPSTSPPSPSPPLPAPPLTGTAGGGGSSSVRRATWLGLAEK